MHGSYNPETGVLHLAVNDTTHTLPSLLEGKLAKKRGVDIMFTNTLWVDGRITVHEKHHRSRKSRRVVKHNRRTYSFKSAPVATPGHLHGAIGRLAPVMEDPDEEAKAERESIRSSPHGWKHLRRAHHIPIR